MPWRQSSSKQKQQTELEKIHFKEIPLQVNNQVLKDFLKNNGVEIKGMIKVLDANVSRQKGAYQDFNERYCFAVKPVKPPPPTSCGTTGM